jgi:hypothetical protein
MYSVPCGTQLIRSPLLYPLRTYTHTQFRLTTEADPVPERRVLLGIPDNGRSPYIQ